MKRRTFPKAVSRFIVLSGLLLAAATPAMGEENYCIDALVSPTTPFVLRGFKIPKAGECSTVIGTHGFSVLSGVACTASNGSHVTFGITSYHEELRTIYHMDLQLPSQFGHGDQFQFIFVQGQASFGFFGFGASGGACASPIPIL